MRTFPIVITTIMTWALWAENANEKHTRVTASAKELKLLLTDEEGKPVNEARVRVVLRNSKTGSSAEINPTSDVRGLVRCKADPYFFIRDVYVGISDAELRIGRATYNINLSQQDYIDYQQTNQTLNLTLPYVQKPIPLKTRYVGLSHRRLNYPKDAVPDPRLPNLAVTEVGYDAEILEPMEPFGRGKHLDFYIRVQSEFRGYKDDWTKGGAINRFNRGIGPMEEGQAIYGDWTHTVTLRFPNPGDGVMVSPHFWPYCKLNIPHQAPAQGYQAEVSITEQQDQLPHRDDLATYRNFLHNHGFFLRVRTQMDKNQNVISAHYAKLISPSLGGFFKENFGFAFFYNPTPNDRNLEYDGKNNLLWQELFPHKKEMQGDLRYDVQMR